MLAQIIVLSVSLSIDAFGIGISYQLKGIRMKAEAKLIVGLMSAVIMYASLLLGKQCITWFPDNIMRIIGVSILMLIGVTFIKNGFFGKDEKKYDRNQSRNIEGLEAVILGAALSADSFSAGFAVSVLDMNSLLIPVFVGIMQFVFLRAGTQMARYCRFIRKIDAKWCSIFSGSILILIAFLKMFC